MRTSANACSLLAVFAGIACAAGFGCTGSIGEMAPQAGSLAPNPSPAGPVTAVEPRAPSIPPTAPPVADAPRELPPPLDAAFTCEKGDQAASPRRIWRLSGRQYGHAMAVFFGGRNAIPRRESSSVVVPWDPPNPADRFSNMSASYGMGESELRLAMQSAREASVRFIAHLRGNNAWCGSGDRFAECVRSIVTQRGPLLFSRPLTAAETDEYVAVASANQVVLGAERAIGMVVQMMLLSPSFMFRRELGAVGADGASRLDPYEVAAALSFTLIDYPPDEALWKAAEANALSTPEQIRPHVERLLAPPPQPLGAVGARPHTVGDHPTLARFLREYLPYERAAQVFKDPTRHGGHKPERLVSETSWFLKEIIDTSHRKEFLRTLLTSNVAFVHDNTATAYGLSASALDDPACPKASCDRGARVVMPATQRAGILTQPSFQVALSKMEETEPVQRGLFIARNLLCRHVPDLPIGQVPPLPEAGTVSTRERLALHTKDPSCAACHRDMDPLGLPFERYDHLGRYREAEGTHRIDASGVLAGAGSADGPFDGPVALMNRLASSPLVERCFVRHAFAFWLGREDAPGDGCALGGALKAFQSNGGDLAGLIAAFLTSGSFLTRSVER